MNCKPNDEAFDAVASSLVASIKSGVKVVISGRAFGASNAKKDVIQECLDKAADKLDPSSVAKGSGRKETAYSESPEVKDVFVMSKAGDAAAVVVGWMFGKGTFPNISVVDRKLVVSSVQEPAFNKMGDKKDYIQKKADGMMKVSEPSHALATIAIRYGLLSVADIKEVADSKVTAANLAAGVVKMF